MIRYVRVFGKWYVHPADRKGTQPEESGACKFQFEGLENDCDLHVNGSSYALKNGMVEVSTALPRMNLKLIYRSGVKETVEAVSFNAGRFAPDPLKTDEFLLFLARRLQALEVRVDQEEHEITMINRKRQGALYLGGAKQ